MIGIWCLTVWQQLGSPSKMRLVELGPGRGTLMADLLRGTAPFKSFISGLDIHLVEVSYTQAIYTSCCLFISVTMPIMQCFWLPGVNCECFGWGKGVICYISHLQ